MKTIELENPFVVGRYVSDKYFCDREEETAFLIRQIVNGRNVVLVSDRRMGKSGLIQHTFAQDGISSRFNTFYVDIYATGSLAEFTYLLGKAVFERLKSGKDKWTEAFFRIVSSLKVGFRMDPVTGEPGLDIGVGDIKAPETTLDEIFRYLETSERRCIVAIDEFQQIGTYAQTNVEALLRTKIQMCKATQFIFSGSKRHLMGNMFLSPAKPFYQSAISMGLEAIRLEEYAKFAAGLFREGGKSIEEEVISSVYEEFDGTTWFVQMMMNELYSLTAEGQVCTPDFIDVAKRNVIQMQGHSFREILLNLSVRQRQVLQAIAREGVVKGISSSRFVTKYKLGSSSSVQSAVAPLVEKDIVIRQESGYRIYDYFFAEWIRMNF